MNLRAYLNPMGTLARFHPANEDTHCGFCGADMDGWSWSRGLDHVSKHASRARLVLAVGSGCLGALGLIVFRILFSN